jgi:hypothetical protein
MLHALFFLENDGELYEVVLIGRKNVNKLLVPRPGLVFFMTYMHPRNKDAPYILKY